jgi:hypothetical protein
MKLFDYKKKEDYGMEHVFTLLKGKRRSFLQVSFSWNDYPDSPYLQIAIGNNRVIDILFWCWKIGFAFELFGITWESWDRETPDEQLLNSLQGTMATIDPYSVKKEAIDEYRIDTIEERLTRIEDKVDLLITQLKIEFYKKND